MEILSNHETDQLSTMQLFQPAAPPLHPYRVLSNWRGQLEPRQKALIDKRMAPQHQAHTLEDISQEFRISRERVRQVEIKIGKKLLKFTQTARGRPIARMLEEVRNTVGAAAPESEVEHLLKAPPNTRDFRDLILTLAGPYQRQQDGWLIQKDARKSDPAQEILASADPAGRINLRLAHEKLAGWGLREQFHIPWLLRNSRVRQFGQQLVIWGKSTPDRIVFALTDTGKPATIGKLMDHIGEKTGRVSKMNTVRKDPRLIRVSMREWGLASWEFPEYSGTANCIRFLIEDEGGRCTTRNLAKRMKQIFKVPNDTTLAYCSAPMFIRKGGWIRLRNKSDKPFRCSPGKIRSTPGVFDLGGKRLGRVLEVNENILRGSGTPLTEAAGAVLDLRVNSKMVFQDQTGNRIIVTFPETSMVKPSLGSVRKTAEKLGASPGQYMTLVLDPPSMSFRAELTGPTGQNPSWETVGRMTGIGKHADQSALARAIHCPEEEVRAALYRREDPVLGYIPLPGREATA